ncbi:hypothetical protein CXB51_013180 [Gossypium anomalum]|uniref:Uncharacterized protein n=1 Tax=Gossypium anomalum TaxID=47600 RepID=A0A8J6D6I8_9ROSI|nr:hypothetical protein CXB51_013180 [Gossypium anomalum]
MDDHLTDDPPTSEKKQAWLRDDCFCRFATLLTVRSSIFQRSRIDSSQHTSWILRECMRNSTWCCSNVKVQQSQQEQMAVMSFLSGLPPDFEAVKYQILLSSEISCLHDAFTRILQTENSCST